MIRAAVLGVDVSKSRSPAIHRAAFRALGVRGTYEALSVDTAGFDALVAELAERGFRYLNVTIPHKRAADALADARGPEVRASGAANTLLFQAGTSARRPIRIRAENTDGAGLLGALADLGVTPRGAAVVMVGAGGAAAGALEALTRRGAQVTLLACRRPAARARHSPPASGAPARPGLRPRLRSGDPGGGPRGRRRPGLGRAMREAGGGLGRGGARKRPLRALGRETAVLEMAYGGLTPLGADARTRTARYSDGLGMLVHQAARAVELALGEALPLPPLLGMPLAHADDVALHAGRRVGAAKRHRAYARGADGRDDRRRDER